ncbi:MAG: TolC family protein [Mariprofundaceae bacterium]
MASDLMSLQQTIEAVLASHPDLALSRIKPRIAATEKGRIEGQLDPVVSASGNFTEDQTPVSSAFSPSGSKYLQLQGNISKPLAGGGTVALGASFNRADLSFTSPLASQIASINPAYRNQIDLSYRHPLFRGYGRPAYHQSLAAAEADTQAATLQLGIVAEQLALRALNLYYQMASNEINVQLANDAVLRARELLAYQHRREEFGLIEAAERLQAEALLATRNMEYQQAKAELVQNRAELNRLMLRAPESPFSVVLDRVEIGSAPTLDEAMSIAEQHRPELQVQERRLAAADARLAAAMDEQNPQLDVVASLGSRSLNDDSATALAQGLNLSDRFVALGLEFSDILGRHRAKSAIRKAELERQQILLERAQSLERIKDEVTTALIALQTGAQTLGSAEQRADAERRKFVAEMHRYRDGRSDTATIVQFEGDLRIAELIHAIEGIKLRRAYRLLTWAEGRLLAGFGQDWPAAGGTEP